MLKIILANYYFLFLYKIIYNAFKTIIFFSLYGFSQSEFQIKNLKNKVVVPFKFINNLIFIPVTINGEELTLLLDTGVEQTLIFSLDDKDEVKLFDVEKLKLKGLGGKDAIDSYKSSKK